MATSSNHLAAPSSSSSSSTTRWDVFLSFYGKDTRKNFTSHLYSALVRAGILTFMDDPELDKGEEISHGLLNAIHGSKLLIVVLSENYAYSRWCLDELVVMLTCKRTSGHMVIPVFYYVDPSHLRHLKGSFKDALDVHQKRYSVDVIEKWKSALAEIAELSGYHLKTDANENESDTVQDIVEHVTPLISTKDLQLGEYLVGIDSSVEEIYKKLSMESNNVRAIGICGMGGIGKTTTAKAFYNKYYNIFDISCFVDDLKQHSQGGNLLPLLQQLLVKLFGRTDYKVRDVKSGVRQLKQFLRNKKALVVVDDLDQSSYSELLVRVCNFFSAGSRIIFTTRDANLAIQLKEDVSEVDICMMRELEQVDSLELFSYHAFRKPTPPECFKELTISFIKYAGGLPLALKVLGSSLLGRTDVSFWNDKLAKVQEIGENDIQKILQLSYDELGDETWKAIFLDIAFFFVGRDKDEAIHIFQSCAFFPNVGIPVLVERCLLTVDENNKFQMHNLIRDMAKEVIHKEFKNGNGRRLYLCGGDACTALQNLEETQKIEGLIINFRGNFSAKILKRMHKLRLLRIIGDHDFRGNFNNSFHELRAIRWSNCPWTHLPSSFRPQKLVSLDMQWSNLKTLWKGVAPSVNLKTINLSNSRNLKITPDFSNLTLVDKLILRGCESLLKVHPSIGQLTNLSHLDLGQCDHLKELTETIGQLTNLSHLNLSGCTRLKELTQAIGQLSKLSHLKLDGCVSLKRLPDAINQLTSLGSLNLHLCRSLTRLPEQLGDMKCLKILVASYTSIEQLPDSIVHLKELVHLKLYNCEKLRKLPEQIGKLESLKEIDAGSTSIEQLPDSIVHLKELVHLKLYNCEKLRKLPEQIGKLESLKEIDASYTSIEQLPDSIVHLKELVHLDLSDCRKLRKLPQQIGKLESLKLFDARDSAIEHLPDTFSGLVKLEELHLSRCRNLKSIPNSLWKLKLLRVLNLSWSPKLEQLPEQLGKMQCLEELSASYTAIVELPDSIGLLSRLRILELQLKLRNLPSSIWNLTSLERLYLNLQNVDTIILPHMVNCMKLKTLILSCNVSLWLPVIRSLSSLEVLELNYESLIFPSNEMHSLAKLSNLQDLTLLNITRRDCCFSEFPVNITKLKIYYATVETLPELSCLKQLKELSIQSGINLQSIPPLPPHLEKLDLYECTSLQDLPDLSMLKELKHLSFRHCINLKSSSLKLSFLQGGQNKLYSFRADIPNTEVAEWFSYKSNGNKISFTIPPNSGDNLFGVGLWIVYKCKLTDGSPISLTADITNKTKGIKENYWLHLPLDIEVGEVLCRVECMRFGQMNMKSGDRITVSFKSFCDVSYTGRRGEVKVMMCGAHLIHDNFHKIK